MSPAATAITRRGFGCALAALVPPAAWAAEPATPLVRDVRARLADEAVLRGSFEQRKSVKGFRHPLVSSGDFVVARQRGVIWRTAEPFPSTLVVTRDRVLARQADGSVVRRLSASEEPAVRAVGETLFGLMSADLAALAQRFQIEGELVGREGWRLQLVPRDAGLARWLQRIDLEGERHVRSVRMQEAAGDVTLIKLGRHTAAAALSPQEEAQFE